MQRPLLLLASSVFALCAAFSGSAAHAQQVVGVAPDGVMVTQDSAVGWSVKKSLLGKIVYNEKDEKVGVITDLLIGPDSTISHVVVAAGGFVGKGHHDVAIETGALEVRNGKFYVEGATRENVKATPGFEYASRL
ncbi:MAG: photosystem reaction center subunit [Betaproteobacteria bacterium]|nr:photosystem reaction center subunit [Betaproteobacteria bacterium]